MSTKLENGTKVDFDEITLRRKNLVNLKWLCLLFGLTTTFYFKRSRYWLIGSFVPYFLIKYMDQKYVPYTELENFYKYVNERRMAEALYKGDDNSIEKELSALDKETYESIKNELLRTNRTIWEVQSDLNRMYLHAAKSELSLNDK